MKGRIRYYDIAKGIAILAVIIGHSILIADAFVPQERISITIYHICFTFHMPLFFIISGYFMHPERAFRWAKESRELLATYGLTALSIVLVNTVIASINHAGIRQTFSGWAAAAYYGAGDYSRNYLWPVPYRIGALWFLLALFWSHLIVHMAYKTKHPWLYILVSFIVGYWSATLFWLPLSIQSGLTASAFVYLGAIAKQHDILEKNRHNIPLWLLLTAVWVGAIATFQGFSMAMNQYGTGWHFIMSIFGAVSGTICICGISMVIDHKTDIIANLFARLGQNSLGILCAHILEDDTVPWEQVIQYLQMHLIHPHIVWVIVFIARLCFDIALSYLLYNIPYINKMFFPYLAKQINSKPSIASSKNSFGA